MPPMPHRRTSRPKSVIPHALPNPTRERARRAWLKTLPSWICRPRSRMTGTQRQAIPPPAQARAVPRSMPPPRKIIPNWAHTKGSLGERQEANRPHPRESREPPDKTSLRRSRPLKGAHPRTLEGHPPSKVSWIQRCTSAPQIIREFEPAAVAEGRDVEVAVDETAKSSRSFECRLG